MSGRHFYFGQKNNYNNSGDNDCDDLLYPGEDETNGEEDVDKDDDSEFLQDVPYSSSSVDRSSIGSIPWADDAIKKNKQDWDRVERMLCGEEGLPAEEPELRHEIEDWQRKFPKLMGKKAKILKQQSFESNHTANLDDSGDVETISNLSLNSLVDEVLDEDNDEDDGFLTPTVERQQTKYRTDIHETTYLRPERDDLVSLLDRDLRITSVKLRNRGEVFATRCQPSPAQQMSTQFLATAMSPKTAIPLANNSAKATRSRLLRMPPILNVIDSNRRFRGLLNNRSFVQLTQVQEQQPDQPHPQRVQPQPHAKSAALTHTSAERRPTHYANGNRSAWHVPLVANRFFNNRNSIVLPAINRHRIQETTTTTASLSNSSGGGVSQHSSSVSSGNHGHPPHRAYILRQHFNGPTVATVTNSSTTPSTGRSISAAVHHPRSEYLASAFYIPYSASKFKAFK